ncbi:MAG: HU family DNA-binding protein [Selenomonadaceae bacterium]|nr:HU family DNA-binding protein [Selenomonadaceae bacterium]
MNKTEFIAAVADKAGFTRKQADQAVDAVLEVIKGVMENDDKLQIPGFGTFYVATRAARDGRNPRTGETIKIPASKVPSFKASKVLKTAANKE